MGGKVLKVFSPVGTLSAQGGQTEGPLITPPHDIVDILQARAGRGLFMKIVMFALNTRLLPLFRFLGQVKLAGISREKGDNVRQRVSK